ncbi:MAG: excinuclease ABC subunit UvrC [Spirochaetia bacterium]|nr:excinuclease ABC subunit UvrC [Spirochaetia bacterium]
MQRNESKKNIKERISLAPETSGCYLWKDEKGEILYVGKANHIRNRLKSYLKPDTIKTEFLMKNAEDVEWISTTNANEALILEANLVKLHKPKFNVRLKDDKRYPYLCVSTSENFPRIYITREAKNDGNRYFGPFTDISATRNTLALIHKIFPVRKKIQKLPLNRKERPCINFHIKRCLAPCQGNISPEEYGAVIDEIILFLEGKRELLESLLTKRMNFFSESMQYESAALYRDMLFHIRKSSEKQNVMGPAREDEDIVALAKQGVHAQIAVFEIREGRLTGRKSFPVEGAENSEDPEIFASFIRDYYTEIESVPAKLIFPCRVSDAKNLETFLSDQQERKIKIISGLRSQTKSLQKLAGKNAELLLKERILATRMKEKSEALEQIQEFFKLNAVPEIIECYDISHFQGKEPVASGVQFADGNPKPSAYRHYNIRHVKGINDPAMIEEVIARRLQRLLNEEKALPDLIVIDGGYTQLSAACRAAKSLDLPELPMVGLAKKHEEIYFPGSSVPIQFDPDSRGMLLIRHIRDEAHRFGITHNRKRIAKHQIRHLIESVPDIGPKRRKSLIKHFSNSKIEEASLEELSSVEGIGFALGKKIYEFYRSRQKEA